MDINNRRAALLGVTSRDKPPEKRLVESESEEDEVSAVESPDGRHESDGGPGSTAAPASVSKSKGKAPARAANPQAPPIKKAAKKLKKNPPAPTTRTTRASAPTVTPSDPSAEVAAPDGTDGDGGEEPSGV